MTPERPPWIANILVKTEGAVGVITLNRPKALNALNTELLGELCAALEEFDADPAVRCIVITGSERAFAAGADIKEMAPQSYMDMFKANFFADVRSASLRSESRSSRRSPAMRWAAAANWR